MLSTVTVTARSARSAARSLSTSAKLQFKVAVVGGAGGIGQPLSMLLKMNPLVSKLAVYDIVHAPGVASDLSHISTPAQVSGHEKEDIEAALKGSDVIIVPAGVPRKPGMTRDDLFNTNASIVLNVARASAKFAPKAILCIISNPVNSTVAIAAEALKAAGVYDPRKLFGVTTLDVVRARTFVAEKKKLDVTKIEVPVIGGHAGATILPLLSRVAPATTFTDEEREALTKRIQEGGTEVVNAKKGAGSATLSMAMAGAEFATGILRGLKGEANVVQCAMVASTVTSCKYFANPIRFGRDGLAENLGLGKLSAYEQGKLDKEVIPELLKSIKTGEEFAAKN